MRKDYSTNTIKPYPSKNGTLLPTTMLKRSKKTLVLDLDETLVHSETKPLAKPDIVLNVKKI